MNKQTMGSWVESANQPGIDFPIENLPYGRFRRRNETGGAALGVAIGDQILDCSMLAKAVPNGAPWSGIEHADLNAFMGQDASVHAEVRAFLIDALSPNYLKKDVVRACLLPQSQAEMLLPCVIGDYTDFYASIHHATAVGRMFRPDAPLLPNYKWVPIGYHGRSSSILVSGAPITRPCGQLKTSAEAPPVFGASRRLDLELEMGFFVGKGNPLGEPLSIDHADERIFGLCLLNDWSARDIQAWEYQPLGPFLSKNFASTISPWVVTRAALEPFRSAWIRDAEDPQPLAYLQSASNRAAGGFEVTMDMSIETQAMRAAGQPAELLATTNLKHAYWTAAQLLTHHASNGCNLRPGDLLGSGTMSGPAPHEAASLLELSLGGKQPIGLANGETRSFIEDGDRIVLRAHCAREGAVTIGFGSCHGQVLAARPL